MSSGGSGGGGGDGGVNRIALCSAIFAGAAYVGYSVARQAIDRWKRQRRGGRTREDKDEGSLHSVSRRCVYLRRLSGSDASMAAAGAIFGTVEDGGAGGDAASDNYASRLVLRPLSVQERIRELNLRARHFAETILAVQVQQAGQEARVRAIQHTRSLQSSPTRSRGSLSMSPIDITLLGSSRCSSVENLDKAAHHPEENGNNVCSTLPRTVRQRWSKRSLRTRSPDSGTFCTKEEQDEVEAEGERMLDEREEELKKRLTGFEDATTRVLTPYEAKSLVALLHAKDRCIVRRALVTVSNSAAFTANQDLLRESGCLLRLQHLLLHSDLGIQLAAIAAVANMSLSVENQKEMGEVVPKLLPLLEGIASDTVGGGDSTGSEDRVRLLEQILFALTNLAALSNWHMQMRPSLSRLLDLTQSDWPEVRMQALRLLVNLSTNEEMVPHLLAAKAPEYVWQMMDAELAEAELLRVITLLANLVCSAHRRNLDPTLDLPLDDRAAEPDSMYSHLFGDDNRDDVLEQLESLMMTHSLEDIRIKARMVHSVISSSGSGGGGESGAE